MTDVAAYDYHLPPELIAQEPLADRSAARLLVVDRAANSLAHHTVRDLPRLLRAGDALVLNDTRVVNARLQGRRTATGGAWEGLFLSLLADGSFQLLSQTRGKLQPGETVTLANPAGETGPQVRLLARGAGGVWTARLEEGEDVWGTLERFGSVPLPPYIRGGEARPADRERYQTVYADRPGAVAAPTAGLHVTPELLGELQVAGVDVVRVTLHVGLATFRPLAVDRLEEHVMHAEWGELSAAAAESLAAARAQGGRVVALGTTSVRVLETAAASGPFRAESFQAWQGWTDLFIRPPFQFRAVDALMTNFHLPRSTLLVLVRTLGGDSLIRRAYETAIAERYRFYSYGDAMLIV